MDDQKQQAKIPIKKSDGTTVFLTMDEFKEYKKQSASSAPKVPKKLEQGKVESISDSSLPLLPDTHTELASTTPVKDIFLAEAKSEDIYAEPLPDTSLLEVDVNDETKSLPLPNGNQDNAEAILSTVKEQFPLPLEKGLEARFDFLVLSRIRDVRSVIDFEQYAKKGIDEGGLALTEDQVRLLLAVIAAAQKTTKPLPAAEPAVKAAVRVATITPVMSSSPVQKTITPFPLPKEEYSFSPPAKVKAPSANATKPIIQDVRMSEGRKQTMGPVDEIQYFSLTDFHRLSPKTENAREILKGKFQALQEESYMMFLDARDAWQKSPLFTLYEQVVLGALQDKKTLAEALQEKSDGLSPAEFDALREINHYLG